jgi:hypothetical protein
MRTNHRLGFGLFIACSLLASIHAAAATDLAGTYFGSITTTAETRTPKDGRFALLVNPDRSAVFLGYVWVPAFLGDLPAGGYFTHMRVYVSQTLTIGEDGAFSASIPEYYPATAMTGGVTPVTLPPPTPASAVLKIRSQPVTLTGKFSESDGVTATLGVGRTLRGGRSVSDVAPFPTAGLYRGGAHGGGLDFYGIADAYGQIFVVTIDPQGADPVVIPSATVEPLFPPAEPPSFWLDAGVGSYGNVTTENGRKLTGTIPDLTLASSTVAQPFRAAMVGSESEVRTRVLNVSGRAPVGGVAGTSTVGFVVRGTTPKTVLVRAAGPSLKTFDVKNALVAPQLQLNGPGGVVAENSGWSSAANADAIRTAGASAGAFPFRDGSADAAILATLAPGNYSAVTSGTGVSGGVALTEAYDVSDPTTVKRLANASLLGFSGSGESALILGFAIDGAVGRQVLIRAIGPALAAFNVPAPLAHPKITLHAANGSVIAANDDWRASGEPDVIANSATATGAFPLPTANANAAVLTWLYPGTYSAEVTGADGGTGNALIEIYDVP